VRTSRDGRIWERDARYFCYAHGPLARTELGDKQVQGTDHFYTIQGWLKGVNSVRLTAAADAGQDAKTTGLNKPFALDAMGYVLRYHGNDYSPVGGAGANTMLPAMSSGTYATAFAPRQLYNGNIPSMLTALQDLTGTNLNLHANVYRYDLLNRIKGQTVYKGANSGTDLSTLASNNEYGTSYDFDPNGNFKRHDRRGNLGGAMLMDGLQYWYLTETNALYTPSQPTLPSDRTNKLAYVVDNAGATTYPDDLETQSAGNYAYDAQGRLTQDILAGISSIAWNLQDKVRSVSRASTNASAPDLEFRYGATGHRTVKVMKPRASSVQLPASQWERTYYIHDAQGNPMAIYHRSYQANGGLSYTDRLKQEDAVVYGGKRLGNWHSERLKERGLTSATAAMTIVTYGAAPDWTNGQGGYPTAALSVTRELGLRCYELANHLGNVLSTVSDRRLAVASGNLLVYYRADEKSYADYDPYGMLLPGRFNGSFSDQNFGFQGQLKDNDFLGAEGTCYAFEYRLYDARIGRFFSIDPLAGDYSYNSPYAFCENNVIRFNELEGAETNDPMVDSEFPMSTVLLREHEISQPMSNGTKAKLFAISFTQTLIFTAAIVAAVSLVALASPIAAVVVAMPLVANGITGTAASYYRVTTGTDYATGQRLNTTEYWIESGTFTASVMTPEIAAKMGGSAAGFVASRVRMKNVPSFVEPTLESGGYHEATFGESTTTKYRDTFFEANPTLDPSKVEVHHAVEQKALTLYSSEVTASEMHSLPNLRGITRDAVGSKLHRSTIRKIWNEFYLANKNTGVTKSQLLDQATKIDHEFGHMFVPPVKK
jgi:RHS repeat-associated protein